MIPRPEDDTDRVLRRRYELCVKIPPSRKHNQHCSLLPEWVHRSERISPSSASVYLPCRAGSSKECDCVTQTLVHSYNPTPSLLQSDTPVIFDCKRGDIGSTARKYAVGNFKIGEALTVSPYLGGDAVLPFLEDPSKSIFVLCKTSNPGSNDLQTLEVTPASAAAAFSSSTNGGAGGPDHSAPTSQETTGKPLPLYLHVARLCQKWGAAQKNVGLVVGATDVEAMRNIRDFVGTEMWFLSPGVGAQGGSLEEALLAGLNSAGDGVILPISRGISKAEDPKKAAEDFHHAILAVRRRVMQGGAAP